MLDFLYKFAQNKYFINKINRDTRPFNPPNLGIKGLKS